MKKTKDNHDYTSLQRRMLWLCVCLGMTLYAYFLGHKAGLFMDEIFSYGLANSYYAPYITDCYDATAEGAVLSREAIENYLTVNEGERFAFGSVVYNQGRDVHPPLYYLLLHSVCSLFPGQFSIWFGVLLNVGIFVLTLGLLYIITMQVTNSRKWAWRAVALYALCPLTISNVLFIRMYMLLTLWCLCHFYCLLNYVVARKRRWLWWAGCALSALAGVATQYLFVLWLFFATLCAVWVLWRKGQMSATVAGIAAPLLGCAGLVVLFPQVFTQLHTGNHMVPYTQLPAQLVSNLSALPSKFAAYAYHWVKGCPLLLIGLIYIYIYIIVDYHAHPVARC